MLYIELARRRKRWSQTSLGSVTGIHQTHVSAIERWVAKPTPDQAERLARALDVPVAALLDPVVVPIDAAARHAEMQR